jgi:hypothetical protein
MEKKTKTKQPCAQFERSVEGGKFVSDCVIRSTRQTWNHNGHLTS